MKTQTQKQFEKQMATKTAQVEKFCREFLPAFESIMAKLARTKRIGGRLYSRKDWMFDLRDTLLLQLGVEVSNIDTINTCFRNGFGFGIEWLLLDSHREVGGKIVAYEHFTYLHHNGKGSSSVKTVTTPKQIGRPRHGNRGRHGGR